MTDSDHPSPRATLERLVCTLPPRLRDRPLDADVVAPPTDVSPDGSAVDVTCWTPRGAARHRHESRRREPPKVALLAEPALPGATDAVAHTLVLEVERSVSTVRVDYGSLATTVAPTPDVRVRTADGETVEGVTSRLAADGSLAVTFATPRTDEALFVEYGVSRNPDGGRHTVDVVVDGERRVDVRLVVLG